MIETIAGMKYSYIHWAKKVHASEGRHLMCHHPKIDCMDTKSTQGRVTSLQVTVNRESSITRVFTFCTICSKQVTKVSLIKSSYIEFRMEYITCEAPENCKNAALEFKHLFPCDINMF